MKKISVTIPFINYTANGNVNFGGTIFSQKELNKALKSYKEKVDKGYALGELEHDPENNYTTLDNITHKIEGFEQNHNGVDIDLTILDTPKGKMFQQMVVNGGSFSAVPRCEGNYDKNGKFHINEIISFDCVYGK